MPKYVRVRDTSGHEITVRGDLPEGHPRGVKPGVEVLDKPATRNGAPLPPKHRLPLGLPLPGGKTDRKRAKAKADAPQDPVLTADPQPEVPTPSGHALADTQMED